MSDVSIIIPVYNRSVLLRETLISCLVQTYRDYEIIVVDDGSEENIQAGVESVCRDFDSLGYVRYIRQPGLGANTARNRALKEALGELIQFVDSDDLLHPRKIEIQREVLLKTPDLDMTFCLDEYFRNRPGDMRVLWSVPDPLSYLDRFLWDDPVWHTGSPLWRRAALERIGPWDEKLICWQDWEFHIRAVCRGIRYDHVPMVLQYIRDHDLQRSTNLASLVERERSKIEAAVAVSDELRKSALWTAGRGDALATFLLSVAMNLGQASDWQSTRYALDRAIEYAGGKKLRFVAKLMLGALTLSKAARGEHHALLETVYRLGHKHRLIPRYNSRWKTVTSPQAETPTALLHALRYQLKD